MTLSNTVTLPTDYSAFIHTSRYSKWLEEYGRRETWEETVDRYIEGIVDPVLSSIDGTQGTSQEIKTEILNLGVVPSMRAVMTAGKAAKRDNTCLYNCSYLPVDNVVAFDEAMFILLCGTGVGFSVERQYVSKLPSIPDDFTRRPEAIVVEDSKEGWAKGLRKLVKALYAGELSSWDVSNVRPAGAKLKVFGGRASGPAPLVDLFNFVTAIFINAKGRKLSSLECHDIMCKIGEVVVVGGVRRSAMISLSNLSDDRMRHAKSGSWWDNNPQRALSNNSVCYTEKPDAASFLREWTALVESGSGERGIFNRQSAIKQAGRNGRRDTNHEFGVNPCAEILLRPQGVCNLSEVVVRKEDTFADLKEKVRLATILGTIQSTYTYFPYLRKVWKDNASEERLLGVSLTGIMDHKFLNGTYEKGYQANVTGYDVPYTASADEETFLSGVDPKFMEGYDLEVVLSTLKQVAIDTNKEWADKLGIPQSTAITAIKPSGTVSQLVDSASGIHARHSEYYIRTVRGGNKDPVTQFMIDQGIPNEPDVMKPDATTVFSFPQKSPEGAVTRNDMTAIQQLEMWLVYQRHWCEHKPSVTISVRDSEWMAVGSFVYEHFDEMSGVSFLPHSGHTYQQAPYQECTKDQYEEALSIMPSSIDWLKLGDYEQEDNTVGTQTFACVGDCEVVDLT